MNAIPMSADELTQLAKLLADACNVIGAYSDQRHWDGYSGRVYQECGVMAEKLEALAKREVERYEAGMRAG